MAIGIQVHTASAMFDDHSDHEEPTVANNHPIPSVPGDDTRNQDLTLGISSNGNVTTYYSSATVAPPPPPSLTRESAARERVRRRRVKSRNHGGEWAWVVIAFALLGVVIIISMSVFLLLRASQTVPEFVPTAEAALPTPVDARSDFGDPVIGTGQQVTLVDGRSIILEPWDGTSRFTVLVMGIDRRPGETGLAYRTDTMMLVSLDPDTDTIGILSIPRDLYVQVPGYSELQRVNTPMVLGELQQVNYGPRLAMQTVQYNLGIRVHDYAVVDFDAFITVVDAIGGIEIDVPYNINDPLYPDMNYGYSPFYLRAGHHHLDGATSLKYARTRHGSSDFQRASRQQQVLFAIRDRILNAELLPQLVIQAPSLWADLSDDIYTGLTLDQMIQLAWYLKDIPEENISTGVIDQSYTLGYTTFDGAQVEVPDRARLGSLMVEVFGANYSE